VQTYSHISNPLVKEITSCFNDAVVKPLNKVVENVAKAVNEFQSSFSNHCKFLEEKLVAAIPSETMLRDTNEGNREGGNVGLCKWDSHEWGSCEYCQWD